MPTVERIKILDELRRVNDNNRKRLFVRAGPSDEYLVLLSEAKVLIVRAIEETKCRLDTETGEILCTHNGSPKLDCRLASCRHATLMRMRLITRLRAAYARERRRLVGI